MIIVQIKQIISLGILILSMLGVTSTLKSQNDRIKPPKRASKIKSVDVFVDHSFELYNKVFVYDSLVRAGYETTTEEDNFIMESMKANLDSLWDVAPDLIDDLNGKISLKKGKAILNLNKSKKAIKESMKMVKAYLIEEKEEDEKNKK